MSYESRHFTGSDDRDELTQPEPTRCLPCDDEDRETPATTSIYRGPFKVPLPTCAACRRAWEIAEGNREPSDAEMEAAMCAHYDRMAETSR